MEKRDILIAFLVVFPIALAIANFQFGRQMDAVVKTAAADVSIVDDDMTIDVWTRDSTVYLVRSRKIVLMKSSTNGSKSNSILWVLLLRGTR